MRHPGFWCAQFTCFDTFRLKTSKRIISRFLFDFFSVHFTQIKWLKIQQKKIEAQEKFLLRFDFWLKFQFATATIIILSVGNLDT